MQARVTYRWKRFACRGVRTSCTACARTCTHDMNKNMKVSMVCSHVFDHGHGPRLAEPPGEVRAGELAQNQRHVVGAQRQRAGRIRRQRTTSSLPSVELVDCSERWEHARPLRHEAGTANAREALGAPNEVQQTHNNERGEAHASVWLAHKTITIFAKVGHG